MAIITWNKKYRETLAVMIERFRNEKPEYQNSKITYAGRLDPLAEGLVILLTDDDVHKKDTFNKLPKIYQVEFIIGFETDSYDALGMVTGNHVVENDYDIEQGIQSLGEITTQTYPPYSSKTVDGKPLWQWSREGHDVSKIAPLQKIAITKSQYISSRQMPVSDFNNRCIQSLTHVSGDFRQEDIITGWQVELQKSSLNRMTIHTAEFHVSSGTYIRSLIHKLGKNLNIGATCLKITRTQVGKYKL